MDNNLNIEQKLMYDLIFGDIEINEIHLFKYIDDINDLKSFIERVLSNLEKSGIVVKEYILILTEEKNIWIIKK